MNEERKKVLEMLAAGKITAEEAERLLDKLANTASGPASPADASAASSVSGAGKPKYLRILVDAPGKDQVNMRVPLSLVGTGRRLLAVMPRRVSERLSEYGIDAGIFALSGCENLEEALREINVNVEHGDGKKVRIYCE